MSSFTTWGGEPLFATFVPGGVELENGFSIILGLVLLILIFALLIIYSLKGKSGAPKRAALRAVRVKCPACKGTTKLPDQPPDSIAIQFIPCGNCGGTGKILTI